MIFPDMKGLPLVDVNCVRVYLCVSAIIRNSADHRPGTNFDDLNLAISTSNIDQRMRATLQTEVPVPGVCAAAEKSLGDELI